MRFSPERSEANAPSHASAHASVDAPTLASADAPAVASAVAPGNEAPADGTHDVVVRPEPGLARGAWEAPAWAFWAALAVVLAATALYAARRFGKGRLHRGSRP